MNLDFWTTKATRTFLEDVAFFNHISSGVEITRDSLYQPAFLNGADIDGQPTKIDGMEFINVSFNYTVIDNFIFENCTFIFTKFRASEIVNCRFYNCRFVMCNFYQCTISNVHVNPKSFYKCLDKRKHQNIGVYLYQQLLKNYKEQDQIEYERYVQFKFYQWGRYQDLFESRNIKRQRFDRLSKIASYVYKFFWEIAFGYGLRFKRAVVSLIFVIMSFSLINFHFKSYFGLCLDNIYESIYFTTISLTTLGYGDITPNEIAGKLFAAFQSVIGFLFFAVFASILFRRVAP